MSEAQEASYIEVARHRLQDVAVLVRVVLRVVDLVGVVRYLHYRLRLLGLWHLWVYDKRKHKLRSDCFIFVAETCDL